MVWILVIEALFVLLGIAGLLFFLRWKQKKQKMTECEALLDKLHNEEQARKKILSERLIEQYSCKQEDADDSAEYMYEAEKQFIQQFLKKQLEQAPLGEFYEDLSILLDQYLYFIPTSGNESGQTASTASGEEMPQNSEEDPEEKQQEELFDELLALDEDESREKGDDGNEVDSGSGMLDLDEAIDQSASEDKE